MKSANHLLARTALALIAALSLSLPAMANYTQALDNGVDKLKFEVSGELVYKGTLTKYNGKDVFHVVDNNYKGKERPHDYNVPIKMIEISGAEVKQSINQTFYIETDNLAGSTNKSYNIAVHVSFWKNGVQIGNHIRERKDNKVIAGFNLPEGTDEVQMSIVYYAKGSAFIVRVISHVSGTKTKYVDPCAGRELIDSKIRFNDWYGQVMIRPNCEEDDAYEGIDFDTVIYEDDRIKTCEESGAILGLEDMSTYVIKPESILIIHTEDANISKFEMLVGSMLVNIKKMAEGKSLEVEMSQCICGGEGTIFAVKETGKESRAYLLVGKASVKNKKTGKKTVLKAGQVVTTKGAASEVSSFNVQEFAKSFGVPQDEIVNHYTNKKAPKYNMSDICGKKTVNPREPKKKAENKVPDKKKQSDLITPPSGKSSASSSGKYARYGAKRGIVKRIDESDGMRTYITTWWDDYGRLERSEITRCEEKKGGKWVNTSFNQLINIIIDDKHYMYHKSLGWKEMRNNETNFLGSGAKTVNGCKLTKSGTATVAGKQCDVFRGTKNGTTIEYYIWEGVPMKRVEKYSDGTSTVTAQSIELPATIDASKFAVPNTAKK